MTAKSLGSQLVIYNGKSSIKNCQPQTEAVTKQNPLCFQEQVLTQFSGRVLMAPIYSYQLNMFADCHHKSKQSFYKLFFLIQIQELIQMSIVKIQTIFLILTLVLLFSDVLALQVNVELPQLKNDTYTYLAQDPVNVTIGQIFSIGVSQFDIQKVPEDFKVYEISQQKFINVFQTMERHRNQDKANQTKKEVDKNIFECAIKKPTMQIIRTLNIYNQKPTNKFSFSSQKSVIYVPVRSRQLIYSLDTASMQLSVHHFTPQRMNFLSSAKINSEKTDQKIAMASGSGQEFLYIFSSEGMWSISTQTVLTNVKRLESFSGFNSVTQSIDKMYHGAYGYLFALKRQVAVYLIPEQGKNSTFITINKYNGNPIVPQDVFTDSRLLYILDFNVGIYVFHILGDGQIVEYEYISWKSYGNLQFVVKEASIFIRYLDQDGQKIVELNYISDKHTLSLVRYYKTDQIISSMSIAAVPVFSSQRLYMTNQPFLFLVSNNRDIELFPYNVDPRTITAAHNGVKMHVQNINQIIYLFEDIYMIATDINILYIRIRIQKPELQCQMIQSTGHVYYQIQFSVNVSTCEHYDRALEHKVNYNFNCQLVTKYMIFVDDPDLSRFQKAVLYGVVFLVVASFVIGLLCLIQWRNNQLSLIGRIKDEIIKLRDRYRKMQPFTQQQHDNPKNSVQFELPEAVPIPDQPKI